MPDPKMLFHMIPGGPKPVAPFSHAVECAVFVTGQMPDSLASPRVLPDGIEAQTRNVMANLTTVLNGIGLGPE
jgi:2-iminobutanoate/2-iminopropanoate deaminase